MVMLVDAPRSGLIASSAPAGERGNVNGRTSSRAVVGAAAALCLFGGSGCGGFFYAIYASGATSQLEAAQALGAEKYAPYEYYYAQEHLHKAMEKAASADYGDAIHLADEAEESAEKAITLSKQAHEGAGR
jgi:hypothetical protein